jgi:hypothetical protein
MAKKRKNILRADIERWIGEWSKKKDEGKYIPYFLTQDVASMGHRYRVPSHTSDRAHHFLSTNEYLFNFHLAFKRSIIRVEEQFVLEPMSLTKAIAAALGVKHPSINSSVLVPVTTDFVAYYSDGTKRAFSIKQEGALEDSRTVQKQYIEKAYWELQGVEWRVVTSTEIKRTKSKTLEALHFYGKVTQLHELTQLSWLNHFFDVLEQYPDAALRDVIAEAAERGGVAYRFAVELFKNAVWKKLVRINLDIPLHFERPASDFEVVRND